MTAASIIKKLIIYGLIISTVLIAGFYVYGEGSKKKYTDYSTFSTEEKGVKALYLLTEQMGFDVERYKKPAKYLPYNSTLVAINPYSDIFNEVDEVKDLRDWVKNGNVLVVITDVVGQQSIDINSFAQGTEQEYGSDDTTVIYTVGKGKFVLVNNPDDYTNKGLRKISPGVDFIDIMEKSGSKLILFDEFYHGISEQGIRLWDLLGPVGQLILLQVLLALVVFMLIKSRRFGRPVEVFSIIKRKENENLFALSNIFIKAKANGLVLETYVNSLKKELAKFLGFNITPDDNELSSSASQSRFLKDKNIGSLLDSSENYIKNENKNKKELINLIQRIEEIRKGLK